MSRLLAVIRRTLSAVGHQIAETIRFGAIADGAAPVGFPAQTPSIAAVAGLTEMERRDAADLVGDDDRD
jgi:hypothetical protein